MIGNWRAPSPRGGACNTSARRSSTPAPALLAAAAALSAATALGTLAADAGLAALAADAEPEGPGDGLDGAGWASAAAVKAARGVASHVAPSRGRSRTLDRGSWRTAGLNGGGGRMRSARPAFAHGPPDETVPRPAADATPICRIDYPRGVPFLALCTGHRFAP